METIPQRSIFDQSSDDHKYHKYLKRLSVMGQHPTMKWMRMPWIISFLHGKTGMIDGPINDWKTERMRDRSWLVQS